MQRQPVGQSHVIQLVPAATSTWDTYLRSAATQPSVSSATTAPLARVAAVERR